MNPYGNFQHGHAAGQKATPTYASWNNMIARCTNPKHNRFHRYGGRGIRVCERWRQFENFLADMGEKPEGMQIDRFPDNDGHYEPGNCRWATRLQQAQRRSTNRYLTYEGVTQTMTAWSRQTGIGIESIFWRLKAGWGVERALTQQVR